MKSKEMDLFEKFWIDHTGCGADDFCFYEGCYTCEYMQDAWVAWQSQQAKIDELQARIDKVICRLDKGICHVGSEALFNILTGNKDEN